jgi:calcium-dependent protein kinase
VLGQGTYGTVYKAKSLKSEVTEVRAIKKLKKKMMPSDEQQNFMAEMELLKKLDHPNIIKLYEIFHYDHFYYVVMEYCRGGTIIDFLSRAGKYSEEIIKLIMYQILSAVRYMHEQKIVHRDLKLENMVFLNEVE